ncbi:MAG: methylated-DNA--[protein]-cysteine S-methyltransferase [Hyphomonadaceae bacterium]
MRAHSDAKLAAAARIVCDARWRRMQARDASANGTFFYSVKTTGVYCLPSCAARPLPENVAFYATGAEAARAGFRPCKNCKPDQFERREGKYSMPNSAPIEYAFADSGIGLVLAAKSTAGLCALLIGANREELRADLRARFPDAALHEGAGAAALAREARAFIDGHKDDWRPALDARGTDFQHRVWAALRDIPKGKTASYADIAKAIGAPSAARAVARACAANPIAILIPCHRVVKGDGGLSGYRWGVARKQALLAAEGAL